MYILKISEKQQVYNNFCTFEDYEQTQRPLVTTQ